MKKILSLLLAIAMVLSFTTMTMAVTYTEDYAVTFGADSYTVAPGGKLAVPVYFFSTAAPASEVAVGIADVEIVTYDGFVIEGVTAGVITDVADFFEDFYAGIAEDIECSNASALFTLNLVAPEEVGTYELNFDFVEMLADDYSTVLDTQLVGATIKVEAASTTSVVVANPSTAAQNGYTANAFKDGAEVRELTIFAQAENATAAGIEIALDNGAAPAAADWTLAADGIGADGTFAVSAYEIKADGANADYEVLTTANVWARAYATGANGTVYSAWVKY